MLKRVEEHPTNETLQSYLGLLRHGNAYKVTQSVLNLYGLFSESDEWETGELEDRSEDRSED